MPRDRLADAGRSSSVGSIACKAALLMLRLRAWMAFDLGGRRHADLPCPPTRLVEMIHQCYFRADQLPDLFHESCYRGFGLEPEVNPELIEACPELKDAATRLALVEYAAMLHHWRNPGKDPDPWIGFTSYRQLAKSSFRFQDAEEVRRLLEGADVLAWGVWDLRRQRLEWLTGAAAQAEIASPMLHRFMVDVLAHFGLRIPQPYFQGTAVALANYWVTQRPLFEAYMHWSWPIVSHALAINHPYKHQKPILPTIDQRKAVGYLAERLFPIWMMREGLHLLPLGSITVA